MSSVEYYLGLLEDRERIRRFGESIAATVKPGDVVLEVGCGLGTYAIAAKKAGAARVVAVDMSPVAIAMAREFGAEAAGVTLVEGRVESLVMDEPASVVIFEDFGSFAHTRGLRAIFDAVHRQVRKDARYVPGSVRLRACLTDGTVVATPDGLPFSAEGVSLLRRRAANCPYWRALTPDRLVSAPIEIGGIDLSQPVRKESKYGGTPEASRSTNVTGLVGWTALQLPGAAEIDNTPLRPNASWNPLIFPFEEPLAVAAGERVDMTITAIEFAGSILWRWSLASQAGSREGSSVNAMPGSGDLLLRASPEWKPAASEERRIRAAALSLLDGQRTVGECAAALRQTFPGRFSAERDALEWLFDELDRV